MLDARTHGIDRCASEPAKKGDPSDDRARRSVKMADEAPACAGGDDRNDGPRVANRIPQGPGLGRLHPALPDTTHEKPALYTKISPVLFILSAASAVRSLCSNASRSGGRHGGFVPAAAAESACGPAPLRDMDAFLTSLARTLRFSLPHEGE